MRPSIILLFLIFALALLVSVGGVTTSAETSTIQGTPDDTPGVYIFTAGLDESTPGACDGTPTGAPTADIMLDGLIYDIIEFSGDQPEEYLSHTPGMGDETPGGLIDTTDTQVTTGLTAIDDFGDITNGGDDDANLDLGTGGSFLTGLRSPYLAIKADGIISDGILGGPARATSAAEADAYLGGMELFILEDGELSGLELELMTPFNRYVINISDFQVNPGTMNGADDILYGIDLDSIPDWDGTYLTRYRITDDGIMQDLVNTCTNTGGMDVSVEIDAILTRKSATVEIIFGSITGNVSEDITSDTIGELPMEGINLYLFGPTGQPVLDDNGNLVTATTDSDGNYIFPDLFPADYTVIEVQPSTYLDVFENEGGDDGDHPDNLILNNIQVTVDPGEEDSGNDFVERLASFTAISVSNIETEPIQNRSRLGLFTILLLVLTTAVLKKGSTIP